MQSHRALLERYGTSFDGADESYRNGPGLTGLPSMSPQLAAGGSHGHSQCHSSVLAPQGLGTPRLGPPPPPHQSLP